MPAPDRLSTRALTRNGSRLASRLPSRRRLAHAFLVVMALLLAGATWAPPALAEAQVKSLDDRFADGDLDAFDPIARTLAEPRRARAVTLTLAGSMKPGHTTDERAAFIVLGLPLDSIFEARPPPPTPQHALYTDAVPARVNVPSRPPTPDLPPPSPSLARAIVHAALRAAGVADGHARLEDLASRARKSALLPEARLRATRYVDDRASVDALPEQSRLVDSSSRTVGLEARLTFRLDRLVFADEEPQLERARLDLEAFRAKITSKALDLLFRHHRARVAAAADRDGAGEDAIAVAELAAALDALTGGFFSRSSLR